MAELEGAPVVGAATAGVRPAALEGHLEAWIASFRGPLIGLIASWGVDWRSAAELAQDVFANAWLSRDRFRGDPARAEEVGPWLRGIAFRLHAAHRRDRARRSGVDLEAVDVRAPSADPELDDERRDALARAFARLSAEQQLVLRMHYLEGGSAREVAALLGMTPKAVEMRLHKARRELRAQVERGARAAAVEVSR